MTLNLIWTATFQIVGQQRDTISSSTGGYHKSRWGVQKGYYLPTNHITNVHGICSTCNLMTNVIYCVLSFQNGLLLVWKHMRLPSRGSMIVLIFFVVACYTILWWIAGFYTSESATFRDWYELIAAIAIVVCVLGYFVIKRLSHVSTWKNFAHTSNSVDSHQVL
jgi:hypothetical protein